MAPVTASAYATSTEALVVKLSPRLQHAALHSSSPVITCSIMGPRVLMMVVLPRVMTLTSSSISPATSTNSTFFADLPTCSESAW